MATYGHGFGVRLWTYMAIFMYMILGAPSRLGVSAFSCRSSVVSKGAG